jgi:aryl-alcohol dehydrogenase-like predicted oxidoreductase
MAVQSVPGEQREGKRQNLKSNKGLIMQYTKLGRTGLDISRLALGTATFGKQTDEAASQVILDKAAEAGVNFLDTADAYPMAAPLDLVGRTEEITGRWLKGKRDRFIVGTKVGGQMGPSKWDQGVSRKHLLDAIDGSLRRLGTDYVDLYSLHIDDYVTPLEESAEALDHIVRSGKARHIGVSNFLAYRLARAIGRQDTLRLVRYVCIQPRYNLLFREIERELLPFALEEGIAVTPFNPLAGGLLTGKYKREETPTEGRFSAANGQFGALYQQRYWHEKAFETVERLEASASTLGKPLPTVAVAWTLANPAITSVILGASKPEQLDVTLNACELALPSEFKNQLDELTVEFRRGDAVR